MTAAASMVSTALADGIALITLERPEARNALNAALRAELGRAIHAAAADEAVRAIILTGAGHVFCAGMDLREIARTELKGAFDDETDPETAIRHCPKPVIAAVNGAAITGGFELVLACDMAIASREAWFADTHLRVGILPGWGLSQRLSRLIGLARAKELSLSGRRIDAETACAWGLVNRVVAPEALLAEARALALEIAAHKPALVAAYKALIEEGYHLPLPEALAFERRRYRELAGTFDASQADAVIRHPDEPGRG
ncbi:enoyl-CoA hydratase [Novosphingobium bradum]|uniref:Enoyl-CoA hydratase n=1 Tax=Novosphingobium bradum TaxID=1737444 RepID=A0ABV7ISE2_9SPHN